MKEERVLIAMKREKSTKGYLNQLRKSGKVPGIFYLKNQEPIPIYVEEIDLNRYVFTSEAHIINLDIEGGEKFRGVLKEVQFDPVSDRVIHFDIFGVTVGEELHLEVPVNLTGSAIGVKLGGVLQQHLHKLEISCLPKNIPESITVDITDLNVNDSFTVADLNLENITVLNSPSATIVSVGKARGAQTPAGEDLETEESAEPEVINKGGEDEE